MKNLKHICQNQTGNKKSDKNKNKHKKSQKEQKFLTPLPIEAGIKKCWPKSEDSLEVFCAHGLLDLAPAAT